MQTEIALILKSTLEETPVHVFDKKLQNEAIKIMKNPKSNIKEKLEAGLVSGVMAGKRKLGLGRNSTNFGLPYHSGKL